MKRTLLFILLLFSAASFAIAQGTLHVVYVLYDNNTDVLKLENNLKNAIGQYKNDDFILYYSDVTPLTMDKSNYDEQRLSNTILSNSSTYSITPRKEINGLSTLLERKYKGEDVILECFVSDEFFDNDYHNSVIAHFLIDNGFHNNPSVSVNYHICGGKVQSNKAKYDDRYNIKNKSSLVD